MIAGHRIDRLLLEAFVPRYVIERHRRVLAPHQCDAAA
jgi:hypothetical protein